MQKNQQWFQTVTGVIVCNVEPGRTPLYDQKTGNTKRQLTGLTEKGMRIHFPENFLLGPANHAQIAAAKVHFTKHLKGLEAVEAKRIQDKLSGLKKMGFHVVSK